MPDLGGAFRQPFAEQVAAFRLRLGNLVPTARWDDLWQEAHDRAFVVAGAMKAELLADLGAAVDKAVSQGTTLEEFRKDFRAAVARHGWHGWTGEGTKAGEAWRTRVIYRTNMSTSYAAGRWAQLKAAGFTHWVYRHSGAEHPRLDHLSWDGLVLPPEHAFWQQHYPPNGWGCGCRVAGARSEAGARRVGGDPGKALPPGWDRTDPKTGAQVGIGKGWGYAPGASAEALRLVQDKLTKLPAQIGADFGMSALPQQRDELAAAFRQFVDDTLAARRVQGRHFVVGALAPRWVAASAASGVRPASADITVRDRDIWHALRESKKAAGKTVPLDWYRDLPLHLSQPTLVALQRATVRQPHPGLLLYYPHADPAVRAVVLVNFRTKGEALLNIVRSVSALSTDAIRSQLSQRDLYTIIEGRL